MKTMESQKVDRFHMEIDNSLPLKFLWRVGVNEALALKNQASFCILNIKSKGGYTT